jgi:type I restriction enzyme R subunit
MERKNVSLELLKKILSDEITTRSKRNLIQSKKFSEMLENAVRRYQNNLITAAQIIDELINLANDIKQADEKGKDLGLSDEETAFYDALANNESAREVLGDENLRELARILVERVKANTAIDWTIKESVRAKLRIIVKRTLRKYGYPPDKELIATENIIKQAELLADEWAMAS